MKEKYKIKKRKKNVKCCRPNGHLIDKTKTNFPLFFSLCCSTLIMFHWYEIIPIVLPFHQSSINISPVKLSMLSTPVTTISCQPPSNALQQFYSFQNYYYLYNSPFQSLMHSSFNIPSTSTPSPSSTTALMPLQGKRNAHFISANQRYVTA